MSTERREPDPDFEESRLEREPGDLSRIVMSPGVLKGAPTIRDTRIPVETILDLLGRGIGEEALLEHFPSLRKEDLRAVFAYAGSVLFSGFPRSASLKMGVMTGGNP